MTRNIINKNTIRSTYPFYYKRIDLENIIIKEKEIIPKILSKVMVYDKVNLSEEKYYTFFKRNSHNLQSIIPSVGYACKFLIEKIREGKNERGEYSDIALSYNLNKENTKILSGEIYSQDNFLRIYTHFNNIRPHALWWCDVVPYVKNEMDNILSKKLKKIKTTKKQYVLFN